MINSESIFLPNISIMLSEVPLEIFNNIRKETDSIEDNLLSETKLKLGLTSIGVPAQFKLRDNLSTWKDFLPTIVNDFYKNSAYLHSLKLTKNKLEFFYQDPWINIQQENEFSPNHTHEGLLSYVFWIKIPKEIKIDTFAGRFEITYTDILGNTRPTEFKVDHSFEGKILVWPSSLRHCVYPFYNCKFNRVSLSGNILIKDNYE